MNVDTFRIGPHTPTMKTEDVHLVHRLWLNITREPGLDKLHHHDILTEALTRFAKECSGEEREEILRELRNVSADSGGPARTGSDAVEPRVIAPSTPVPENTTATGVPTAPEANPNSGPAGQH